MHLNGGMHVCIYVTGIEIRIQNSHSGSCMGKGKEVGDISRCAGESV